MKDCPLAACIRGNTMSPSGRDGDELMGPADPRDGSSGSEKAMGLRGTRASLGGIGMSTPTNGEIRRTEREA